MVGCMEPVGTWFQSATMLRVIRSPASTTRNHRQSRHTFCQWRGLVPDWQLRGDVSVCWFMSALYQSDHVNGSCANQFTLVVGWM